MSDLPLPDVQAVIMAGGEGTRLRPLTVRQPKPMVPVGSRPVMAYLLQQLRGFGVRQAFATLYYLADEVEGYFGDGSDFGLDLRYSVEDTPLGTAGSVSVLANQFTGTVLVVSGDALTDIDLAAAVRFHRERGAMATLVLTRVPAPLEFGVVIVDPEGRVVRFLEKPSWGEVFSDTVNTGIYVLEPEVWEVPLDRPTDFSGDLFPALLERSAPLYGYIAEGYWTDIGGLDQYQQANFDLLDGRVKVTPPGRLTNDRVWVGEGTQIHPTAVIEGPALIGRNGAIGPGVRIGPFTAIGDHAVVEANADVERSIVWNNVYLGRGARLSGATVCHNVVVKANVHIGEGAVIGDRCLLEEGTTIQPHIKLWPNKITEPGSKVTMSLIWGTKWPGSLFGATGVAGLANVEITPEFATRLGAAFGAYLDRGAQVITSRDTHHVSRMTKRAIIAGLMSVGANILDLRAMPAPVTRHMALVSGAAGGLHVSLSPSDPALTLIEFFDGEGKNLNRQAERKIENIFFREDFRRSHRDDVGSLEFLSRTVEYYTEDFLNFVRADVIRAAGPKLVVDYAHGALCLFMPVVLGRLGCESIALNAYVDPTREALTWEEHRRQSEQIGDVVTALGADLGVVLASHGERMAVTDETGHALSGDELLACYARLLQESRGGQARIAVSVSATSALDALCDGVMRTKADPRSLMEVAAREPELDFVGDDEGGFVFPQFQPAFDAMVSLGKLLELLARTGRSLSAVRAELPAIHKLHQTVACPWEMKGQIMRQLHEETRDRRVDHTDGIKIFDGGWVLVLPDISGPLFHVYGEADSDEQARALVDQYCQRITALQEA